MLRRHFIGSGLSAIVSGSCAEGAGEVVSESYWSTLLCVPSLTFAGRFFYFQFKKGTAENSKTPPMLARHLPPEYDIDRYIVAEAANWENDEHLSLTNGHVFSSGSAMKELQFANFKSMRLSAARNRMTTTEPASSGFQFYPMQTDVYDGSVAFLISDKLLNFCTMLVVQSGGRPRAYLAEKAKLLDESELLVQLSGTVISCGTDQLSVVSLADVFLKEPGIILSYVDGWKVDTIQKADATAMVAAVKLLP